MPIKTDDLVFETTLSTGSGPFVLAGAVPGHRRFAEADEWSVGDSGIAFVVRDPVNVATGVRGPNRMVCAGTLTADNMLDVDIVYTSNSGGGPAVFGPGAKDIYSAAPSELLNLLLAMLPDTVTSASAWANDYANDYA